ncbi:lantibiotic dehydratase [Mucilaginibacter agri]|uniref:Thiopeptide-type bacteriocin biosynthesis domain-containing protein n=1 Tax=Mucilaginibacter agri TaxID=2695265 RepID=A0A965ZDK4_9SPHI|nr:lantibiotic dehydratase [Mucilaginibacter agri]NCD69094.1 hypothetical protein [Mucilaginibacter agri]
MKYQFSRGLLLRAPYFSYLLYDPERLPVVLQKKSFQDALWLASPSVYEIARAANFELAAIPEKAQLTLHKYYNRMCFRAIPFGAFASVSHAEWGDEGGIEMVNGKTALLHYAPDVRLADAGHIRWKKDLQVGKNPLTYRVGNSYRYWSKTAGADRRYRFHLQELETGELNDSMFRLLEKGPLKLGALATWVAGKVQCDKVEARRYMIYLLQEQVLCPVDTTPLLIPSGADAQLKQVCYAKFRKHPIAGKSHEAGPPPYACLERPVASGNLDPNLQRDLLAAVQLLCRLNSGKPAQRLADFRKAFYERYELRKVPLLTLFDPDSGLPYGKLSMADEPNGPTSMITKSGIPSAGSDQMDPDWKKLVLSRLLSLSRKDLRQPIVLEDIPADPANLSAEDPFPGTLAVLFRKGADRLFLDGFSGSSATQLAGRFSRFSKPIREQVADLAEREQAGSPDVIFADINHRSEDHTDNINSRAQVFGYQISLELQDAGRNSSILYPDDLLVSVSGNELILESRSLNKRVIPRLSTAYNFRRSEQPLFNFLCDLQYQGLRTVQLPDLAQILPEQEFYPRIEYRGVVISRAKWLINRESWPDLFKRSALDALNRFRAQKQLPDLICLVEGDQELTFDLRQSKQAVLFLNCIRNTQRATLTETAIGDGTVKTGHEPYAAQFMAFLHHGKIVYNDNRSISQMFPAGERTFGPGSPWLYLKIYATPQVVNRILAELVEPVLRRHSRYIRKWFFIRYTDPGNHLRVRFLLSSPHRAGALLVTIQKMLRQSGLEHLITGLVIDTYRRELERYGAGRIEEVEGLFQSGSDMVLQAIADLYGGNSDDILAYAIRSATMLMEAFYPESKSQAAFTEKVFQRFLEEFKSQEGLLPALAKAFRQFQSTGVSKSRPIPSANVFEPLRPQERAFLDACQALVPTTSEMNIDDRSRFVADLVHMQMNRTFMNDWRANELVVWYCLSKITVAWVRDMRRA